MAIFSSAKVRLSIGTSKATAVLADYTSDTWTEVKEIEDVGQYGDSAEVITFAALSDARLRKAKGVRDAGTLEITVARDPADAGQNAMRAALASDLGFNFKIELTDKPSVGASPKNTIHYFKGLVNEAANVVGSANDITKMKFTIAITQEILEVAAAGT